MVNHDLIIGGLYPAIRVSKKCNGGGKMKSRMKAVVIYFFVSLLFVSCGDFCHRKDRDDFGSQSSPKEMPRMMKALAAQPPAPAGGLSEAASTGAADFSVSRQIIYSATIKIEVKDFEQATDRIRSIVESAGGFVSDSRVEQDDGDKKSGAIEIRVPKARFNDVITDLKALGKVKGEDLHGYDVTEEYTDLETRLANSKKLEERLLELLKHESNKLKDLLEVEKELARVREDIERAEGRKRLLDDRLTLSTITIELFEPYTYTSGVFDPLKDAFDKAGSLLIGSLAALVTMVAVVAPWFIVLGVVGFFAARRVRRWWRKKRGLEGK